MSGDCPERVRVGWDAPGTPDNTGTTWRCWAVCDACGHGRVTTCGDGIVAHVEFVERIEEETLAALHGR